MCASCVFTHMCFTGNSNVLFFLWTENQISIVGEFLLALSNNLDKMTSLPIELVINKSIIAGHFLQSVEKCLIDHWVVKVNSIRQSCQI